jgi:hypothetical protein
MICGKGREGRAENPCSSESNCLRFARDTLAIANKSSDKPTFSVQIQVILEARFLDSFRFADQPSGRVAALQDNDGNGFSLSSSGKLNLAFSLGGDAAAGRWTEPPASNNAQNAAISCPGTAASYRPEGYSYALVEGKKEEDVKLATCTFEWYCRFGRK